MKKPKEQQQIFDVIWNNLPLSRDLFGSTIDINNPQDRQESLIIFKSKISSLDNKLFGFITSK